ncbi:seminal vesicle protein SVP-2-like [Ctenodactylus gundi]
MKFTIFFILSLLLVLEKAVDAKIQAGSERAQDPVISHVWSKEEKIANIVSGGVQDYAKHPLWEEVPVRDSVALKHEHIGKSHLGFKDVTMDEGGFDPLKGNIRVKRHDPMEEAVAIEDEDSGKGPDAEKFHFQHV